MSCGCTTCYQLCDVPQCTETLKVYVGLAYAGLIFDAHLHDGRGRGIVVEVTVDVDGFVSISIDDLPGPGWFNPYNGIFQLDFTEQGACERVCLNYDGTDYSCLAFHVKRVVGAATEITLGPASCTCITPTPPEE